MTILEKEKKSEIYWPVMKKTYEKKRVHKIAHK